MKTFQLSSLILLFLWVAGIFWFQDIQFMRPVEAPQNTKAIQINQYLDLSAYGIKIGNKPIFIHFYNPECNCSKFNADHFKALVNHFGADVDFITVILNGENERNYSLQKYENTYKIKTAVILDPEEKIAKACGIYATPQTIIIDQEGKLYYKGNFNKAGICTARGTSFAEIALKSITKGKAAVEFLEQDQPTYGCPLPSQNAKSIAQLIF